MLHPLIILLIGVVVVIGMIIVLRVNAFIALVTAAMLVSLLSPGELPEKIARVAAAFGSVVGSIGIVIAMAAVIGKCLMDSGAADRIVRSFLRALGEKRASVALMGSGFVLAIPVFFDTVFYLLVPLARSLWKRTRKNYVLYVTAIVTGGAVTHTLVPPTPGPLFMANRLNIDLGVMIMVGVLIGLPTAICGLIVCHVISRLMDLPMRPYAGEPEPEVLDDDQLPSLWISLLPVVLPVILISVNTVTKTLADAEHAARLRPGDFSDWPTFSDTLACSTRTPPIPVAQPVMERLPDEVQRSIVQSAVTGVYDSQSEAEVRAALNDLLADTTLFDEETLATLTLPEEAAKLLERGLDRLAQAEVERFNRFVLEAAFPGEIQQHVWQTPRRRTAQVAALLGDPNLALLISAAIAMFVLVRNRGLTLHQLGRTTETALMSGGVVILITAGGGAFGAMLRTAGVQGSIESLVDTQAQGVGLMILIIGFAVAAVLKVAQGSSTVSMITAASIFAAMGASSQMLGCNTAYLATAVGSGALVGSWMNDSGFWIFARMSALTEVEALKSWTILLAIIGFVGLGFTLLFASVMPMV